MEISVSDLETARSCALARPQDREYLWVGRLGDGRLGLLSSADRKARLWDVAMAGN